MKTARLVVVFVLLVTLAFGVVSCVRGPESKPTDQQKPAAEQKPTTGTQPANKAITVGFSVPGLNHPLFAEIKKHLEAEAKRQGVNLVTLDAQLNTAKQIADIEDLITKKVDLVILIPNDGTGIVPAVEKINQAKIPLVVVTRSIAKGEYIAYVGSDDKEIGRVAGNYIATRLNGKGKVVEITGQPGTSTANDRSEGFNSVMKTYPAIKIVARQTANYQRGQAMSVMENILQSNPEIDAVFAANDEMAGGAIQAIQAAGRRNIIVVGCNAQKDALEAIQKGVMAADITFPPETAKEGLKLGLAHLKEQPYPKQLMLPIELITKGNVEHYLNITY